MAFEPEKITKADVYNAVNKIAREHIILNESTGYDVIIDGRPYPPKEIIRISHQLATGYTPGPIYGGQMVNTVLEKLGFEIRQKAKVWKLGCNWDTGNPSFYEMIKEKQIVLGVHDRLYKPNDLVLIAEGFTVYAIAKVSEALRPITEEDSFASAASFYNIPYEDWVMYAAAQWYELPKTENFIYQLQSGIRQVRKKNIREKAINIWENQGYESVNLSFYSAESFRDIRLNLSFPCFVLEKREFKDNIYQTSFNLIYCKTIEETVDIGVVKILQDGSNITTLDDKFEKLSEDYCSLGQTLKFYDRLQSEFPTEIFSILKRLNDCAFYVEYKDKFENFDGFKTSLINSSEAALSLDEARSYIRTMHISKQFRFSFSYQVALAARPHLVEFEFYTDLVLKNRLFCIIGKNGTGKTQFMSQLANKLTDMDNEGEFTPSRPLFSKIIAVSFSYFDKFSFPREKDISYDFIGIKNRTGLVSETKTNQVLWEAYQVIALDKEKKEFWLSCIKDSIEIEYLQYNLTEFDGLVKRKEFIDRTEEIFSSGQKIIFQFITRLLSTIEINSLILFDEPETHLHPNITGRLLRTVHKILDYYKCFAILSTHSPVIVQEFPSKFVKIFDRRDNIPLVFSPAIECFGENLSIISNSIFQTEEEKEYYKTTFDELRKTKSIEEINNLFGNNLGLNAQLYIQSVKDDQL